MTLDTDWYKYRQNNSGGIFVYSDYVANFVLIEASSVAEANSKAESIGIYFNGLGDIGIDCDCCGERWSEQYKSMAEFTTYQFRNGGYGATTHADVRGYAQALADNDEWADGKPAVIVYFADGSVERFTKGVE
jgi:hypothetical protein